MKFREKLAMEHPECVDDLCEGGCYGCPYDYGYEIIEENGELCDILACHQCWDREIPETKEEKKMRFKVGDKIKIREDLIIGTKYGNYVFNHMMEEYKGQTLTISNVNLARRVYNCEESGIWSITDEMIETADKVSKTTDIKEMVNHPARYNTGKREVIEEMRILFGDEQVRSFCKLNAYKCIRRAEHKGNPLEDFKKAEWYMDYLEGMDKKDEK